mgnify:FL=1
MNSPFQTVRHGLLAGLLAFSAAGGLAAGTDLPAAQDLRADANKAARAGGPLIVVYSRKDCKYCETVKRDYLKPLTANPRYRDKVVIRQINQDSDAPLIDFRGEATTHARFAASEKIKLVPVVAFYGPQGKHLAEPIVGARLPDFYPSYLEESVEKSSLVIKAR